MKNQVSQSWAFLPMDRNTGKMVRMCTKLYFSRLMSLYSDYTQFRTVQTCVAHEYGMSMC